MSDNRTIRVLELFAGVDGFRKGLEQANSKIFNIVWANQWEPSRKAPDTFDCYTNRFNSGLHSNEEIAKVTNDEFHQLPQNLAIGRSSRFIKAKNLLQSHTIRWKILI